ncbi:hypothetical protein TVAG_293780 [Trichomonas vaginalis G3]|uniref:Right handed beta helix domain-containing protein n=1 Tax=Trichomonas vaginalis (strain ATCC PRA-98 / G3) TaxID=412133 RepID=A2FKA8_TRIV3|nr:pectin lyase-like family [Trichomonas vaginalis G3]EAX94648.1 hypothetical protein TVAG_293780 [Trichomonas vaginalis G3]KAI5503817.1 pectin lyase-like family [Trichomonas vaginalis G3]|eukprot:XP_001307578.1 hypothetical protein [Trichomonas vaginalis G3]
MSKVSKRLIVGNNTNIVKNTLFDYIITDKDGALFAQKIQFLVKDCIFSNNQANNGGAVAIINCSSDFLTSNITRCSAINKAGAIHAIDSTLNIENQYHYGCECEAIGGAAIFKKCTVGIKFSNYLKCRAYSVAVFYLDGNTFSCSNSNFLYNVCKNNLSPLIQTFYNNATFYMCYFKNNSKGELLSVSEGNIIVDNSFLEDNLTLEAYNSTENIKIQNPVLVEPQISLQIIRPEKRKLVVLDVDESDDTMPLIKSIALIAFITIVSYLLLPSTKKSSIYQKGETIHP